MAALTNSFAGVTAPLVAAKANKAAQRKTALRVKSEVRRCKFASA